MLLVWLLILVAAFVLVVVIRYTIYSRAPHDQFAPDRPFFKDSGTSEALVLYSKKGPYTVSSNYSLPQISESELLIRNHCIGLNPIDWKCVSYGFGIHALPWISGRECAGEVEEVGVEVKGWRRGDRVWVCSTNYRDNRTSAFQKVSPHILFFFKFGRLSPIFHGVRLAG